MNELFSHSGLALQVLCVKSDFNCITSSVQIFKVIHSYRKSIDVDQGQITFLTCCKKNDALLLMEFKQHPDIDRVIEGNFGDSNCKFVGCLNFQLSVAVAICIRCLIFHIDYPRNPINNLQS